MADQSVRLSFLTTVGAIHRGFAGLSEIDIAPFRNLRVLRFWMADQSVRVDQPPHGKVLNDV